ncbi:ABC transporter ATP-binding protein [Thorsellia anophelis]|uniref:Putative ABC transport system ATP-binding protein n=1 Tax=Thorsellia anophelis DSM 18579 TaxID=1123402 RepID=A0A1I0EJX4_9GAMM|nr:ABC transporter ATP-binding protein [Thorsellia anophelis]SET44798.1 putative ABC transport system ATP-binding protein [Thorsellia anophelis DSM 18579]
MLHAENLTLTFNPNTPIETLALRGLSLRIPEGQFVTVIGSNGAGKSTFLNAISGEQKVDSGSIKIDGLDVTKLTTWERSLNVARVFQDPMAGTCELLTIEENLAIAASRGRSRNLVSATNSSLRKEFQKILKRLDLNLENRLNDRIGLLSGGQRQAISLLMATMRPSKILLLDEHTAALDPKTAAFVLALTDDIVKEGHLTTMMVTHSMRQALEHGDRTIMLHEGKVVLDVSGSDRDGLTVSDLLEMFERVRGETLDDDGLLLSR